MSLTGAPFLVVTAVIAVALPVLTALIWTRVRGPRVMRGLQRWALVALCQICALVLAGVALNDYGLFIASWSEVGGQVALVVGGGHDPLPAGTATTGRIDIAGPQPSFSVSSQWPVRGRLEHVTITGAESGLSTDAYVYLPPQYFQPRYHDTSFPGVEVFSGYPGTTDSLVYRMHYPEVLLHAITSDAVRPMVMVLVSPSIAFPRDTECTNVPAGPQVETFFGADLPTGISAHYRVRATGWGAIGASTGGYCSAKLAMLHPGRFAAAVAMSAHFSAVQDRTTGDLWGGSQAARDANDLNWRLAHLPAPPVAVLVCTSPAEVGQGGYQDAMRFVGEVKVPMSVSVMTVPNGGHSMSTWSEEVPVALPWLSAELAASEPDAGRAPGVVSGPASSAHRPSGSPSAGGSEQGGPR